MKNSQKFFTIFAIFAGLYCVTFLQRNEIYQLDQFSILSQDEADELNQITIETCSGIMDISNANNSLATDSQVSASKSFINSLASTNPSFGISAYLNKQKGFSAGSLPVEAIGRTAGVWIAFFVFSVIGWFCYTICCCCDNCCPPQTCCKKCRRDIKTNPYTKAQWMAPGIIAIIMSLTIIGSGAAGLVYAPSVASGLKSMQCALVNSMNNMIQTSSTFEGVQGLKSNIQQIYDGLNSANVISNQLFNPPNNSVNNSYLISQGIDKTDETFAKFDTITNNTKLQTDGLVNYVNLASVSQQLPLDLNNLGITTSKDVLPGQKTILLKAYNALLIAVNELMKAGQPITQSSFMTTISSSIDQSNTLLTSVESQALQLYRQTKPMTTYSSQVTLAVQSLFGISMLAAVFILIGGIIILGCKKWKARVFVHLGWCMSCIIMILGFLLGTILNPISVISVETCSFINDYLNDEAQFNQSTIITGQMQGLIRTCIYGDGDMLNFLNLTSSFSSIETLSTQIDEFNTIINGSYNSQIDEFQKAIQIDLGLFQKLQNQTYQDWDTTGNNLSLSNQKSYWKPAVDAQNNLINTSTEITNSFNDMIGNITDWMSIINDTIQLVTNNQTGILANDKCTVVKYQLNNIYSAFCVIFLPAVYRTTVLILIIAVAMFFGSLAGCCFGLRASKMAEQESMIVKVENGHPIKNEDTELQAIKQNYH